MEVKTGNRNKSKSIAIDFISFRVNGQLHKLQVGSQPDQVDPTHTLAHTLRETLSLTGPKVSCDSGAMGMLYRAHG